MNTALAERPRISPAQKIGKGYNRFWHNENFYRVVKGSRGSKKSRTTAINLIYRLMKYPWANVLVVRRFSNTNKQSTYMDLKWAAGQLGVKHFFKFNEGLPEITYLPTGQKILFRGLDDPLKITSITVDVGSLCWAWFEEAYQIENFDKFSTVVESIRGSYEADNYFKQITVTFNPWNERHWLKEKFFDEETRLKNTFATTTTFRCNEWLDSVDIERYEDLYITNPRRARIVCDGDWGVAEGLVFSKFHVQDFDIQKTLQQMQHIVHGTDWGFTNDPTTEVSAAVDLKSKKLYIYQEHYQVAMTTDMIYKMLVEKGLQNSVIEAEYASGGDRIIAELKNKGIRRIKKAKKAAVEAGLLFLQDFEIIIHPSCANTIEEFNTYTWTQDKNGKWLNVPIDMNNHIIDALRYAVEPLRTANDKKKTEDLNQIKSLF